MKDPSTYSKALHCNYFLKCEVQRARFNAKTRLQTMAFGALGNLAANNPNNQARISRHLSHPSPVAKNRWPLHKQMAFNECELQHNSDQLCASIACPFGSRFSISMYVAMLLLFFGVLFFWCFPVANIHTQI